MAHDPERLAFWRLHEPPFDDTRNPRFFFPSGQHGEALDRMVYLVRQGNVHFGMLSGEIGAGKSITASVLQQRISDPDRLVVYLPNSHYDFPHLIAELISGMVDDQIDFDTYDEYVLTKAFERVCEQALATHNRRLVVILDEAQQLSDAALIRLRSLTNLGGEYEEFHITFILVGQPELRLRVKQLPQLDQRIALRFHLNYIGPDETEAYLKHRLLVAGHPDGDIFEPDVYDPLYQATSGIPRELSRYARLTMDNAFARRTPRVDLTCALEIVEDQKIHEGSLRG